MGYTMIRNGDENTVPQSDFSREITWNDFCNYLLETGQVDKIVVTNNHTIAKVFLKPGSQGLPQHQNRQFRYLDRRKHSDENEDAFLNDSTLIQNGFFNRKSHPNQHQVVYRFAI